MPFTRLAKTNRLSDSHPSVRTVSFFHENFHAFTDRLLGNDRGVLRRQLQRVFGIKRNMTLIEENRAIGRMEYIRKKSQRVLKRGIEERIVTQTLPEKFGDYVRFEHNGKKTFGIFLTKVSKESNEAVVIILRQEKKTGSVKNLEDLPTIDSREMGEIVIVDYEILQEGKEPVPNLKEVELL